MSYDEHLISMAGGDGERLAAIEARIPQIPESDMSRAERDRAHLLTLARTQQAALDRVIELAHWAGKRGWTISAAEIRTALEAS